MSISTVIVTTQEERRACYAIRERVFVQEQHVPLELEMDALDDAATHFLMVDRDTGEALGTARLLEKDGMAKIGRVALLPEARGRGLGRLLMEAILEETRRRGYSEALLDSQTYVIPFYERLGFTAEGPEFDDAGIPHRRMRRAL